MRKSLLLTVCMSMTACIISACDSTPQNNTYELACIASGGHWDGDNCKCNTICPKGVICSTNGDCAIAMDDTSALQKACEEAKLQYNYETDCSAVHDAFDFACIVSGGNVEDHRCKCGDIQCTDGIICKKSDGPKYVCSTADNEFRLACEASNGKYVDGLCECDKKCKPGMICDNNGKCAFNDKNALELVCLENDLIEDKSVCSTIKDELQLNCYSNSKISDKTKCNQIQSEIQLSCLTTSGEIVDNGCQCGQTICPDGIVCNDNECASSRFICLEGQYRCFNNPENNQGVFQICSSSNEGMKWEDKTSCNEVSCSDTSVYESEQQFIDSGDKCGQCLNGSITPCESGEDKIGKYSVCINGYYSTDKVNCSNNTSCTIQDDDTHICGICENGTIQCAGEHEYKECTNGEWPEESIPCPGLAECKNNKCEISELEECQDDEYKCTEDNDIAYWHHCIGNRFAVEQCPESNHCTNEQTCGECYEGDRKCENTDSGSILWICDQNHKWNMLNSSLSCMNNQEIGVCTNGNYRFDNVVLSGPSYKDAVIQRCANGIWPEKTVTSDTINYIIWPNNKKNDSLFSRIMRIDYNSIDFYSNYMYGLSTDINPGFTFSSPEGKYILPIRRDCQEPYDENGPACKEEEGQYFVGGYAGCAGLYHLIHHFYTNEGLTTQQTFNDWFSCSSITNCHHASFCVDTITTGQFYENINPNPYIVTFDEDNDIMTMEIEKSPNLCNSNRTAAKGNCTDNALDMTNQFSALGSFEEQETEFDICRYGSKRHVTCNKYQDENGIFTCQFDEVKENTKAFDSTVLCLDFYDSNYNHTAYKFVGIHTQNMTKVSLTESDPDKYIIKCPSNLCNDDWTDCLSL